MFPILTDTVGEYWFCESAIESVTFLANVKRIKKGAFWGCRRLTRVTFASDNRLRSVEDCAFGHTPLTAGDVEFPEGAQVSEKAFAGW